VPEDKKKKKPSLGERMLITGMAGGTQVKKFGDWYAAENTARTEAIGKAVGDAAEKTKESWAKAGKAGSAAYEGAKEFVKSGVESGKKHRENLKAQKAQKK
jgi:hypothetical protein